MKEKLKKRFWLSLLVFLLALTARLVFLFFFAEADKPPIGDVWHHWQIAYLSKTIGFKHGFLRLWDFKGMEYYWGLLHPLVLIIAFTLSRSVSIVIPRIVSTLFGSGVVALIFLIVSRYFNKKTALAAAVFLSLMPITLFHDAFGLQEPLGLFFLLLGIYFYPRHSFMAGFSLMLAGMARAEYWLFGAGLVLAVLLRERNFDRKITLLFGYSLPCLFYLKYMLDYTGNPIYPVYWNFLGVGAGEWAPKNGELTASLQMTRTICRVLTISFLVSGLVVLWKRLKPYLFLLLGLANLTLVFSIFGFSTYLYGYNRVASYPGLIDKIWIGKLLAFPWGFLGVLAIIFLIYFLPKKRGRLGALVGVSIFLVGLGASQFVWPSIIKHYSPEKSVIEPSQKAAAVIASQDPGQGTILLPSQSEYLTYFLAHDENIAGERLASSFYDPFYYYQGEDPFSEWSTFREKLIKWLQENDASLLVVSEHEIILGKKRIRNYGRMLELEEGKLFKLVANEYIYRVYQVKINEE